MKRHWLTLTLGTLLWQGTTAQAQVPDPVPVSPEPKTTSTITSIGPATIIGSPSIIGPASVGQVIETIPATEYADYGAPAATNNRRGRGFYAGGGFYYLTPRWNDARAFDTQTSTTVGNQTRTSTSTTFIDHNAEFAPKVWVGYTGESGFGVRGSWWRLDSSSTNNAVVPPTDGITTTRIIVPGVNRAADDTTSQPAGLPLDALQRGVLILDSTGLANTPITTSSRLEMDVWDLEVNQQFQSGLWALLVGGGVRYARLDQQFSAAALATNVAGVAGDTSAFGLNSSNIFEGVGPQLTFEALRRLGDSGFSIYANGRAGILFGEKRLSSTLTSVVSTGGVTTDIAVSKSESAQDTVPFVEFEGGVGYTRNIGSFTPFIRAGVVGQNWFNVGNPSSNTTNRGGDLGLFGFQLTAGLNF